MMTETSAGTARTELIVPGMVSDHCAGIVRGSIERLSGVGNIRTNISSHKVTVDFDPRVLEAKAIRKQVEDAGYEVAGVSGEQRVHV